MFSTRTLRSIHHLFQVAILAPLGRTAIVAPADWRLNHEKVISCAGLTEGREVLGFEGGLA